MTIEQLNMKFAMNSMPQPEPMLAPALFEPAPDMVYSIEQTARLAHVPRRTIAIYFRHGLVSPVLAPDSGGWYFDDDAIRTLRQIEYLRNSLGMNTPAIKLMFDLMREVEQLRQEVRFL